MQTEQNDLIDQQFLEVTLNIKAWGGVKRDPKHEAAIRKACGATRKVGHFDKYLVSKDVLADIKAIDGAWRNRFYALTLYWSDTSRLTTVSQFPLLTNEMRERAEKRSKAVDKFCRNYPDLVEQAKVELNGEFDPANYPTVEEVRGKFEASFDYFAVRRGSHLNNSALGAVEGMVEGRQAEIEEEAAQKIVDALADFYQRIVGPVAHFKDRMVTYGDAPNPKASKSKRAKQTIKVGKFKADTIEGLRDMVKVLPGLNIYDDPRITDVLQDIEATLLGTGSAEDYAQELRDDDALRAKKAEQADAILDKMAAF